MTPGWRKARLKGGTGDGHDHVEAERKEQHGGQPSGQPVPRDRHALTFGSLLLLGGRAGDMVGHRRLLLAGLALFGVSSLGAGLSLTPVLLIASRFVQGASVALAAPSALALLTALFDEGPPRTRAGGYPFAGRGYAPLTHSRRRCRGL